MKLTETRDDAIIVVGVACIPADGVDAFVAYERKVLSPLPEHGGELRLRFRGDAGGIEVHVLAFGSASDFARYRNDPRRSGYGPLLEASGAQTSAYELRVAPLAI